MIILSWILVFASVLLGFYGVYVSDKGLIDKILSELKVIYAHENVNDIDGVKISFEDKREWVHLRKSNTEPIIRIYSEAPTEEEAVKLGEKVIAVAEKIISSAK